MNNGQNELIRCAMEKIRRDEKFKPDCCFIIPTGPTALYDYFFNKINRNYSFSKKYTPHKNVVYILISLNNFYFIINL